MNAAAVIQIISLLTSFLSDVVPPLISLVAQVRQGLSETDAAKLDAQTKVLQALNDALHIEVQQG